MTPARKLAVTLVAMLLGTLGVEVYIRLAWRDQWDAPVIRRRQAEAAFGELVRFSGDAALYYELRPDLDLDFHGSRVVTDSGGFRVPATPRAQSAACKPGAAPLRVAVVGPSTTFGFKLPIEQSYPELLVPSIEALSGRPVELRNVSVPGYNAEQEACVFEQRVLPWKPDLVLWHYDHRDAFPVLGPTSPIELSPEFGDNPLHWATLKLLRRTWRASDLAALRGAAEEHERIEGYIVAGPLWDRHLAALARVASQAKSAGVPVVLVLFDAFVRAGEPGQRHFDSLHAAFVPSLEQLGFHVIDMYPNYQHEMTRRGWKDLHDWWLSLDPPDGHPNAAGHVFLADRVAAWLSEHPGVLPAGTPVR